MAKTEKPDEKKSETGASIVAVHPLQNGALEPVEKLARAAKVPDWECAAMMHAAGWSPGKVVNQSRFDAALDGFRKRPMGGGRLKQ